MSKQSVAQALQLTDAQKKLVAGYEKSLIALNDSVKMAYAKINKDLDDKKLSDVQAIIERANVEAMALSERKTTIAKIQEIYPAWTDTLVGAIKIGAEKTAQGVELGAEKSGEQLGNLLQVPVSAGKRLWDSFKTSVTQRI
jgi:hypothetical protein